MVARDSLNPGAYVLRVFVAIIAMAGAALLVADDDDDDKPHEDSRRAIAVIENSLYKTECGSCHLAFAPGLLPERSWVKLMAGLKDHFGESAELEKSEQDAITKFLVDNAADRGSSRSKKIAKSIPSNESPLRITETPYFKRKHHEVKASVWNRKSVGSAANCQACHPGAEKGRFTEHEVRIPK